MQDVRAVPTDQPDPGLLADLALKCPPVTPRPFILDYFEHREGVYAGTSTGYWNDPDSLDAT